MNAGPDVERLIAGWLQEEAPGRAPDRILELAGRTIDRTHQRRFAAWRPTTMFDRLAVAGVSAVLAIGVLALGSFLMRTSESAAAPCPAARDEADAIDTFVSGLSAADRTWGGSGAVPDRVGPGLIAAFAYDEATDERTLIAIDPVSGQRCILIRHVSGQVQSPGGTQLDWSPLGDALAIGLAGDEGPEGQGPGQLMIWTPGRLLRVWTGEGTPYLDWSPDGRSIAVWTGASNAVLIQADGSADRTFEVRPVAAGGPNWNSGLSWSPDGSRWVITTYADAAGRPGPTTVSIVDIGDGRVTPVNLGIDWLGAIDWIDDGRMLLREWDAGAGAMRYLDVPVATPERFAVVPLPDDVLGGSLVAFSPDHTRAAFVVGEAGPLSIVDVTSETPGMPVVVDAEVGDVTNFVFWSPDSSQVLFHTNETVEGESVGYRMWITNADGSGLREIGRGNVLAVDDSWQPLATQER
jgi:hypothetical protein